MPFMFQFLSEITEPYCFVEMEKNDPQSSSDTPERSR
jgi:hypothetical protein